MKRPVIDHTMNQLDGTIYMKDGECVTTVTKNGLIVTVTTKCPGAPSLAGALIGAEVLKAINRVYGLTWKNTSSFLSMLKVEVQWRQYYPIANLHGYSHQVVVKKIRAAKASVARSASGEVSK